VLAGTPRACLARQHRRPQNLRPGDAAAADRGGGPEVGSAAAMPNGAEGLGNYASDKRIPPPATNSKPAQPITEGRSPRKAKPTKATINKLNRSTGTTKEASPCFKALKKQNDDRPLARPEITMNSQVRWDITNGPLIFPVARMSNGRKIAMTIVRIKVARSASISSRLILPNIADAVAKSADRKAQINQSGRAGIGLIYDEVLGGSSNTKD
jgi:hypothetical protein